MPGLAVCLTFLLPATLACLAYLVPTLAGRLRRTTAARLAQTHTFSVLIPAHNEEATLPEALRSLAEQNYPACQVRVYVVADNCTDGTATAATGTTCLVRNDPHHPGKGRAVAFGLEHVLADRPDAVLILDADCDLNPEALRSLNASFNAGAIAVQAAVRSRNADAGPAGYVAAVGAAVDAAVAAGRDRLGLSVPLRGTGMAFRREVLERVPWDAFGPVEDAEYSRQLHAAGVRVRFCEGAEVSCDAPAVVEALCRQRRRWRAAARFVSSKPLVLLHLAATVIVCAAFGVWVWPLVLALLTSGLYLRAMAEVGFTRRRLRMLLGSARLVARLGWLTLAGFVRTPSRWEAA
jgi:cellulose synthase/poly-beta-1,6-N-acetylglucosamine synthase-like glycosyltransferase